MQTPGQALVHYWKFITAIGVREDLEEFDRRKLALFNQLNFFEMLAGLSVALIGLFFAGHLPPLAWYVACAPIAIGIIVLWLNYEGYYEFSRIVYFSLYPVVTCLVYLGKVDVGVELFFLLYGVMSVFFLQRLVSMVFSLAWSSVCYILAVVMPHDYYFRLRVENYWFFFFNQALALAFIFYTLYLIKKENTSYQQSLHGKGKQLQRRSQEIELQRQVISGKARLLELQTQELLELNQVQQKLFSVIAHDLKTPVYALRNLFNQMLVQKLPAKEVREQLPGIVAEMNHIASLMENLLQWAKMQMKNAAAGGEVLEIGALINSALPLLQLQAENKQVYLEARIGDPLYCRADGEMVKSVLRNLISNAIKFTPAQGSVSVSVTETPRFVEVSVQDTGVGMDAQQLEQLSSADQFYTTRGTDSETGTGIGLKLCRDFLARNGGQLFIQSERGKGSVFTFTLPKAEAGEVIAGEMLS